MTFSFGVETPLSSSISIHTYNNKRYPESRIDYVRNVGHIGEYTVIQALMNLRYEVDWGHVNSNECDISIEAYSIGVEVWNHCQAHCYMDRCLSVINNLQRFKHKFLVASFISKPVKRLFESCNIKVLETGFQVLPCDCEYQSFYSGFKGKKYLNDNTVKIVMNLLKSQLPSNANVYSICDNVSKCSFYNRP